MAYVVHWNYLRHSEEGRPEYDPPRIEEVPADSLNSTIGHTKRDAIALCMPNLFDNGHPGLAIELFALAPKLLADEPLGGTSLDKG